MEITHRLEHPSTSTLPIPTALTPGPQP
jgi:hypothetical protein